MDREKCKTVGLRLGVSQWKDFCNKCARYGKPPDIMRELIKAFTEDRISIQPPKDMESLYVTRETDKCH